MLIPIWLVLFAVAPAFAELSDTVAEETVKQFQVNVTAFIRPREASEQAQAKFFNVGYETFLNDGAAVSQSAVALMELLLERRNASGALPDEILQPLREVGVELKDQLRPPWFNTELTTRYTDMSERAEWVLWAFFNLTESLNDTTKFNEFTDRCHEMSTASVLTHVFDELRGPCLISNADPKSEGNLQSDAETLVTLHDRFRKAESTVNLEYNRGAHNVYLKIKTGITTFTAFMSPDELAPYLALITEKIRDNESNLYIISNELNDLLTEIKKSHFRMDGSSLRYIRNGRRVCVFTSPYRKELAAMVDVFLRRLAQAHISLALCSAAQPIREKHQTLLVEIVKHIIAHFTVKAETPRVEMFKVLAKSVLDQMRFKHGYQSYIPSDYHGTVAGRIKDALDEISFFGNNHQVLLLNAPEYFLDNDQQAVVEYDGLIIIMSRAKYNYKEQMSKTYAFFENNRNQLEAKIRENFDVIDLKDLIQLFPREFFSYGKKVFSTVVIARSIQWFVSECVITSTGTYVEPHAHAEIDVLVNSWLYDAYRVQCFLM